MYGSHKNLSDKPCNIQTQNFVNITEFQKHGPWSVSSSRFYLIDAIFVGVSSHFLKYSLVARLQGGRFTPGAIQLIQLAESTLSPDAEASNVSSRSEPQEVQFVHVLQSDAYAIIKYTLTALSCRFYHVSSLRFVVATVMNTHWPGIFLKALVTPASWL